MQSLNKFIIFHQNNPLSERITYEKIISILNQYLVRPLCCYIVLIDLINFLEIQSFRHIGYRNSIMGSVTERYLKYRRYNKGYSLSILESIDVIIQRCYKGYEDHAEKC